MLCIIFCCLATVTKVLATFAIAEEVVFGVVDISRNDGINKTSHSQLFPTSLVLNFFEY